MRELKRLGPDEQLPEGGEAGERRDEGVEASVADLIIPARQRAGSVGVSKQGTVG